MGPGDCEQFKKQAGYSKVYKDARAHAASGQKNPKLLGCFKSVFWAESSNIVGADMIENINAALSGDSEN